MGLTISLAAEPVAHIGGITITNSMLTACIVTVALILIGATTRLTLRKRPGKVQLWLEFIHGAVTDMTEKVTGNHAVAQALFPFIVTSFLFILISNWLGLLPGISSIGIEHGEHIIPILRSPTADLNTTLVLALCSVCFVQYLAIKHRGAKDYLGGFYNFSSPLNLFVGQMELLSEITRILSYSVRLFGNIFAGEVLIATVLYLTSTFLPYVPVIPLPFYLLELFVGLIQAIVFCFLTIIFAGLATQGGHSKAKEAVR